jgi:hypothetical protein
VGRQRCVFFQNLKKKPKPKQVTTTHQIPRTRIAMNCQKAPHKPLRTRELGVIEASSAFRHDMNIYLSVAFGATIASCSGASLSHGLVFTALRVLANRHAALSTVLVHDEVMDTYRLKVLSEINLNENVAFKRHESLESLETDICRQVSSQFEQINEIPPWRLWLTTVGEITRVNFFFHHSVFDGTSAKLFLVEFNHELNKVTVIDDNPVVQVPAQLELIPSIETLLGLDLDLKTKPKLYDSKNDVNVWSGNPVLQNEGLPVLTQSLYLVISNVKPLVTHCKKNNTSITALLLVLALDSLNKTLIRRGAHYEVLRGTIPRNLRPLVGKDTEYGDFVSSIEFDFKKNDKRDLIELAQEAKRVILDSVNRGAEDSIAEFTGRAGDQRYKYEQRPGNKRAATMEVSTILVKDTNASNDDWALTDFRFLQGTSAEGAPLTCSAISQQNGGLAFSFSWSTEIIDNEIVEDMHREFGKTLIEKFGLEL